MRLGEAQEACDKAVREWVSQRAVWDDCKAQAVLRGGTGPEQDVHEAHVMRGKRKVGSLVDIGPLRAAMDSAFADLQQAWIEEASQPDPDPPKSKKSK